MGWPGWRTGPRLTLGGVGTRRWIQEAMGSRWQAAPGSGQGPREGRRACVSGGVTDTLRSPIVERTLKFKHVEQRV